MPLRLLRLRLAVREDATEIALMSRDLIEHGLGWSWTRSRVARNIAHADSSTVVACSGRQLIGFAMMYFGDDHAHLNLFAVKQAYQRNGVGRRMITWLEGTARTAGISAMHLEVRANNVAARGFYKSLGFREMAVLPGYYGSVEAAVWMARALRTPEASRSA